jgi:hypothetical protein
MEAEDLASMHPAEGSFPSFDAVYGPPPPLGAEVCEAPAKPARKHRCGEVEPPRGGFESSTMIVEPGNSGSGVYDAYGHLVGIAVHMTFCGNGQICGSEYAPLLGRIDDL